MSFEAWQAQCAKVAKKLAHIHDLLDEDDPYDVFDTMQDHYDEGMSPEEFIRETFADQIEEEDTDLEDEDEDEDDEDGGGEPFDVELE